MHPRSLFVDVLDEKLREFSCTDHAREPAAPPSDRYRAAHPLLFAVAYRARVAGYPSDSAANSRARRVLSPPQQRALATLNRLGAGLTGDFTPAELRSAFRRLARRFHPDRHPTGDRHEQARLARVFAEIVDQHRSLAGATC